MDVVDEVAVWRAGSCRQVTGGGGGGRGAALPRRSAALGFRDGGWEGVGMVMGLGGEWAARREWVPGLGGVDGEVWGGWSGERVLGRHGG